MAGKAIGRSLTADEKQMLIDNIPSHLTNELQEMSDRIENAQHWSEECLFEGINFATITPACIRWTVKQIEQVLKDRKEAIEEYMSDEM